MSSLRPYYVHARFTLRPALGSYHARDHVLHVPAMCSLRSYYVQPVRTTRLPRVYQVKLGSPISLKYCDALETNALVPQIL